MKISLLADKHGRNRESLMPILQEIVKEESYLSKENMIAVAKELDIATAEVFGTASFYTFLDTKKKGKFVIRVCKSIIAEMKGKQKVIDTINDLLKINVGETTADGKFTLLETNDIGWANEEPSMLINDKPYTNLSEEKVKEIIGDYIRNK